MTGKIKTSSHDRIISGVCGGLGEAFSIPPIILRLVFIFTMPMSIFVYFILKYIVLDDGYI